MRVTVFGDVLKLSRRKAIAAVAALIFCLVGPALTGVAAEYEVYDYGDVNADISDISFYRGPENTDNYNQTPDLLQNNLKNVIILIGDGMGTAHIQLARMKAVGASGKLYMEMLPIMGLVRTHSANAHVTDSAAACTAFASGIKTKNGKIGMDPDRKPYQTLLEAAQAMGKRTGLVATSTVSHATPAAFASHVKNRGMEPEIAAQILDQNINVIFGGGRKHWEPQSRSDGRDLMGEARAKGYLVVADSRQMEAAEGDFVLGLFEKEALKTFSPEPSIGEMMRKAINLLNNPRNKKGFFVMIEGSQIDWAAHANNADNVIKQTLLFDLAVREAIEFAAQDRRTLVIVTSDHETGGLTVFGGSTADRNPEAKWSTGGHSALDVPLYAFGPGSHLFSGTLDNTEVAIRIAQAMGVKEFPKALNLKITVED